MKCLFRKPQPVLTVPTTHHFLWNALPTNQCFDLLGERQKWQIPSTSRPPKRGKSLSWSPSSTMIRKKRRRKPSRKYCENFWSFLQVSHPVLCLQVIASMTVGKDVSALFPDVVNCMQTDNLELKKLVYLYLMNYAKSQPDMAIMAVNTFVKVGPFWNWPWTMTQSFSTLSRKLAIDTERWSYLWAWFGWFINIDSILYSNRDGIGNATDRRWFES